MKQNINSTIKKPSKGFNMTQHKHIPEDWGMTQEHASKMIN